MLMVEMPSVDSLRQALAPMEALRGAHSQWESWVRESLSTLESLHGELSDWQRDLVRQGAQLDQQAAAMVEGVQIQESDAMRLLHERVEQASRDLVQLEEENAEQLQAIEDLERQLAVAKTELRLTNERSAELTELLETERERAAEDRRQWSAELREMRRLLQRQNPSIAAGATGGAGDGQSGDEPDAPTDGGEGPSGGATDFTGRTAELRRRAESRRAAQRRNE
jgi:chromosome segregation ATPase